MDHLVTCCKLVYRFLLIMETLIRRTWWSGRGGGGFYQLKRFSFGYRHACTVSCCLLCCLALSLKY